MKKYLAIVGPFVGAICAAGIWCLIGCDKCEKCEK